MKMAKASEADLNMAMDLSNALENLAGRWGAVMPEAVERLRDGDESEHFDIDKPEQAQRALRHILQLIGNASLMRVVFGCAVMLDPVNRLVDPDADTIEHHPDRLKLLAVMKTETAKNLQVRLAQGIGPDTDDGRTWLAAFEVLKAAGA